MTDLNFDDLINDIVVEGGDLTLSGDKGQKETARQSIKATLRVFQGEWFLDNKDQPTVGVPYMQQILGFKGITNEFLNTIMSNAILSDKHVNTIEEINSSIDPVTRTLSVDFSCTLKSGQTLEAAITVVI